MTRFRHVVQRRMVESTEPSGSPPIEIPFASLSPEAQEGVLSEFIYREGTDYGAIEASLERKQADLVRQIERGDVKLVFDPATETVTLITASEWKRRNAP